MELEEETNIIGMLCSEDKRDVNLAKGCLKGLMGIYDMETLFHVIDKACVEMQSQTLTIKRNKSDFDRVMQVRWEFLNWYREKRLNEHRQYIEHV